MDITLPREKLSREPVYVTDKHCIFCQYFNILLTYRQSNDFQSIKSFVSPAGEAQERAYPTTHCRIENASVMAQI